MFISTQELAKKMGKHPQTIYKWLRAQSIPKHCYQQHGTGPIKFLEVAVTYYAAHGCWPATVADQAEWARQCARDRIRAA